jgi:hypothetical protein
VTDVPQGGPPDPRSRAPRRGRIIGGAIALSVVMIGAGIGIGAAIWSGGSSTTTVSAARNGAAPVSDAAPKASDPATNAVNNYNWLYRPLMIEKFPFDTDITIVPAGNANCVGAVTNGTFRFAANSWVKKDVGAQINSDSPCNQQPSYQVFDVTVEYLNQARNKVQFQMTFGQLGPGKPYYLNGHPQLPPQFENGTMRYIIKDGPPFRQNVRFSWSLDSASLAPESMRP